MCACVSVFVHACVCAFVLVFFVVRLILNLFFFSLAGNLSRTTSLQDGRIQVSASKKKTQKTKLHAQCEVAGI
jgi:hypothetical protein